MVRPRRRPSAMSRDRVDQAEEPLQFLFRDPHLFRPQHGAHQFVELEGYPLVNRGGGPIFLAIPGRPALEARCFLAWALIRPAMIVQTPPRKPSTPSGGSILPLRCGFDVVHPTLQRRPCRRSPAELEMLLPRRWAAGRRRSARRVAISPNAAASPAANGGTDRPCRGDRESCSSACPVKFLRRRNWPSVTRCRR